MDQNQYAFGVDLGGTKIEILKVDAKGSVLGKLKFPTEVSRGPVAIIEAIVTAVKSLSEKDNLPLGIGLGVAGQIEKKTGKVFFGPNLKWRDVPLGDMLRKSLNMKVVVLNDVRAATLGELIFGSAKGALNVLSIFVGTGIGGGIILDGKILSGPENSAGEIGHMIVDMRGHPCTCGSKGCLETIAGGWGMEARAKDAVNVDPLKAKALLALALGDPNNIKGPMIHQAAKEGDPLALSIIKDAEDALISGTASLVNVLNPSVVVFGGGIIDNNPDIVGRIEQGVRKKSLKAPLSHIAFVPSSLKGDAGAFGAAASVLNAIE